MNTTDELSGWRYYNHAAIPVCAPHETADLRPVEDGRIWRIGGGRALLARWTEDWDCGEETNWWYLIKDEPFDPAALKAKRRYEITKGERSFAVRRIAPEDYASELYRVTAAAYSAWPEKYRPHEEEERFLAEIARWEERVILAAFDRESGALSGYAGLIEEENCVAFSVLRTDPACERAGINAALVAAVLRLYGDRLSPDFYVCDGERAVRHETAFQDYLEKYFGFRKGAKKPEWLEKQSQIAGVMKMEEIRRG